MEIKKSKKADLEGQKGTGLLIGYILALATMLVAFEWTTKEYIETEPVIYASYAPMEEETPPITQPPIFTAAPPPPAEVPKVAEILDIVENDEEIEEEEIQSTEDTNEAVSGPVSAHTGPQMTGPVMEEEDTGEGEVFQVVEQMPMFPGGDEALLKWLYDNLKYPSIAQDNGIQGRVMVQFTVNKDGSIVDPEIFKGVDGSLDKEALRVVKAMPKWSPGKQRGKTVRVRYTLPIMFRLQ